MSTTTHTHLELARELAERLAWHFPRAESNAGLEALVLGVNEYSDELLPGASMEDIRANLAKALELASEPVPEIANGRSRVERKRVAERERADYHLLARVCLALLEGKA